MIIQPEIEHVETTRNVYLNKVGFVFVDEIAELTAYLIQNRSVPPGYVAKAESIRFDFADYRMWGITLHKDQYVDGDTDKPVPIYNVTPDVPLVAVSYLFMANTLNKLFGSRYAKPSVPQILEAFEHIDVMALKEFNLNSRWGVSWLDPSRSAFVDIPPEVSPPSAGTIQLYSHVNHIITHGTDAQKVVFSSLDVFNEYKDTPPYLFGMANFPHQNASGLRGILAFDSDTYGVLRDFVSPSIFTRIAEKLESAL